MNSSFLTCIKGIIWTLLWSNLRVLSMAGESFWKSVLKLNDKDLISSKKTFLILRRFLMTHIKHGSSEWSVTVWHAVSLDERSKILMLINCHGREEKGVTCNG